MSVKTEQEMIEVFKSPENLREYLDFLQESYNNTGNELVPDETFDAYVVYYETISGKKYDEIGAKSKDVTEKLPFYMPSLNKAKGITGNKDFNKFLEQYSDVEDLYLMDKEDGLAVEIEWKITNDKMNITIWKRGDGEMAPNISHIIPYIKLPPIDFDLNIRGELIMYDKVFDDLNQYLVSKGNKAKNSRNIVSSATKIDTDPVVISNCTFIPFHIHECEKHPGMKLSDQLKFFKHYNFTDSPYISVKRDVCTFGDCVNYLNKRRTVAKNRIDGVVVYFDIPMGAPGENKNPDYAIAIKQDSVAIATVIGVHWNMTSKDGYLTPVADIIPVNIIGSTVSTLTCHNGKMIFDNKIGPGATILMGMGGDVIPRFYETIKPADVTYGPNIPYTWCENYVKVIALNYESYPQVHCCKIKYFLDCLGIKKWGLLTIFKLYKAGFTNIGKIIRASIEDIMVTDGVLYDGAFGLHEELQKGISKASLPKIMAGSGVFGGGISMGIAEKFIEEFPTWKIMSPSYEEILSKNGFGPTRAKLFAIKIDKFKDWIQEHPELEGLTIEKVRENNVLQGQVFTFTGFTDEVATSDIEKYGGKVLKKFRSDVTYVAAKNVNSSTDKTAGALKSGGKIKLISQVELIAWLAQIRMSS